MLTVLLRAGSLLVSEVADRAEHTSTGAYAWYQLQQSAAAAGVIGAPHDPTVQVHLDHAGTLFPRRHVVVRYGGEVAAHIRRTFGVRRVRGECLAEGVLYFYEADRGFPLGRARFAMWRKADHMTVGHVDSPREPDTSTERTSA